MSSTILQLISSNGFFGAEAVVLNLSRELNAIGWSTAVCLIDNGGAGHVELAARASAEGIAVEVLPCRNAHLPDFISRLRKLIRDRRISLIHTHGYKADLLGYWSARTENVKIVATCHNWTRASMAVRLYSGLDRRALRRFHRVVAVSAGVRDRLVRAKIADSRIRLIKNGVRVPPALDARNEPGSLVIGTVARLDSQKGIDILISAFARIADQIPAAQLMIVGDGPERSRLENMARGLGIHERVQFTGYLNDIGERYRMFDVFVLPSFNEGMPIVIAEAMASGVPVVATRVGAIPTMIHDRETGFLIEPGDRQSLAERLMALATDDDLRTQMGLAARAFAERHLSARSMAMAYADVYEQLLPQYAEVAG